MFQISDMQELAARILDLDPHPIPRYLLMRDVLHVSLEEPGMKNLKMRVMETGWVDQLAAAQNDNGIWNRFHSQDTKIKATFPTTEFAIQRALALGLDKHDTILAMAVEWMEKCLKGQVGWSDRVEKSEGWPAMTRAITASTLARVDPFNPLLEPERSRWQEIALRTFRGGFYNHDAEQKAHRELNGLTTCGYYTLNVSHPLILLSTLPGLLPTHVEKAMLKWAYENSKGIGYVVPGRLSDFPLPGERRFTPWLDGLHILLRFRAGHDLLKDANEYIHSLRSEDGFWKFNRLPGIHPSFPLSDSWRKPVNKKIDQTVHILTLLSQ